MSESTTETKPNQFSANDADRLWDCLTEDQKFIIETDLFIQSLPVRKELKAIAVLVIEALKDAHLPHYVPLLVFDAPDSKQPHQGIFRIPRYTLLTEHWKQCPHCQTLQQDLTLLVQNMID